MQRKTWYSILGVDAMPLSLKNLLLNIVALHNSSRFNIPFGGATVQQRRRTVSIDDTDVEVARRFCHSYIQQSTTMSQTVVKDVTVPVLLKGKKCKNPT